MATWCIEAATCLQAAGHNVTLAIAPGLESQVPAGINYFKVEAFRQPQAHLVKRLSNRIVHLLRFLWPSTRDSFAGKMIVHQALKLKDHFDHVLWNQTNLFAPGCTIPQWVVGWAYPITLNGYLKKLNTTYTTPFLSRVHNLLYWYRMDNRGYRKATGVLAVSSQLTHQLQSAGIRVAHCPPGIGSLCMQPSFSEEATISMLICATWLDDPRKQVIWLANALSSVETISENAVHFIGDASPAFIQQIQALLPHAQFHGLMTRDELMQQMQFADMLLFGSSLDDWGYVQIEAMAMGLTVFAPRQLPSIEIVPDAAYLYEPGNTQDFVERLKILLNSPQKIRQSRRDFFEIYCKRYNSHAFAENLLAAMLPNTTNT